jgi:DNA-directed RNA polymerase specialized sigma24 family protein
VTAEPREHLLDYLQRPATRRSLDAYIRRRGLSDSADDLVQTVLCDALAAPAVPDRSSELPRFVTGIARNKVVDEHRRRARWKHAELPDDLEAPRAAEARAVLRRIDDEVVEPEERRALSWLVQEHAGDSLYLMALEQALAPTTLRQRICRLRKSLRARYLAPLVLALGLGYGWSQIAQQAAPLAPSVAAALSPYAGSWRVLDASPARYRHLAERVVIDHKSVRVFGPSAPLGRELTLEKLSSDAVTLRYGKSLWVARLARLSPDRLQLSTPRGFVDIERQR